VRNRVLPYWGVDFQKIRRCTEVNGHPVVGTFNVTDFGAKRLKVIPHTLNLFGRVGLDPENLASGYYFVPLEETKPL